MNYIKYEVKVYPDGSKFWYLNGNFHREDGPAIEYANVSKFWYLNGNRLTEQEFSEKMNSCAGASRPLTISEVLGFNVKAVR